MNNKQAEIFKVLGVDSRIRIISLLKERGWLCVNEISELMGISSSAVSQHLKILKFAGLVQYERKGYWIHYAVVPDALEQCKEVLFDVCTCCCCDPDGVQKIEFDEVKEELELLTEYEKDLMEEVDRVKNKMMELKKKK